MKRNFYFTLIAVLGVLVINLMASNNPQSVHSVTTVASATYDLKLQQENETGNTQFGMASANAGDVNGDGFEDLIAGAPSANQNTGQAYIYFGGSNADDQADLVFNGEAAQNFFGYSVSGAGDVNNDGFADVLVGAYGYNGNIGRAYVFFGGSAMDSQPDLVLAANNADGLFGFSLSSAGDVNGDNFADVIVGEPAADRAYIYLGGLSMDSTADLMFVGGSADELGFAVSTAGDVNGDSYDDVLIASPGHNSETGLAEVFFGAAAMDTVADLTMTGQKTADRFGEYVAGVGDLNQDNYADFAVSAKAYEASSSGPNTGKIYVFLGGASPNNVPDFTATGENGGDAFGSSLAGNTDVNADGYDDIVVGAPGFNAFAGKSYLFYGSAVVNGTADWFVTETSPGSYFGSSIAMIPGFSADAYGDIFIGAGHWKNTTGRISCYYGAASTDTQVDLVLEGEKDANGFSYSFAGVESVDGDLIADLIIGATDYQDSRGRAYLYKGGSTVSTTPTLIFEGPDSGAFFGCAIGAQDFDDNWNVDIAIGAYGYNNNTGSVYIYNGGVALNNTADLVFYGHATGEKFGYALLAEEDLNQDGYADLVVGAPGYNNNTGRVYVYFGGEPMDNIPDLTLNGENAGDKFGSTLTAADVDMDTYHDLVVGAPEANSLSGKIYLYLGGSTWDATVDWSYAGTQPQEHVGSALGSVLFDGDGFADILVGADGFDSHRGRAYLFYGSSAIGTSASLTFEGGSASEDLGRSVAGIGDINNDGYEDLMIGADASDAYTGKAEIYFGGETPDIIPDITLTGEAEQGSFGHSVAFLGDLNNDAYPDIAVGAITQQTSGVGYVYYGSDMTPPAAPTILQAIAGDAQVDLFWSPNEESDFYKYFIYADTLENPVVLIDSTTALAINDTSKSISGLINGKTYYFRLTAKDRSYNESDFSAQMQATPYDPSAIENSQEIPRQFSLSQNYPNPFNPSTTIRYALPERAQVKLVIYDILGTKVVQRNFDWQAAGNYNVSIQAAQLGSGIYFYRLTANGTKHFQSTKRMVLIR